MDWAAGEAVTHYLRLIQSRQPAPDSEFHACLDSSGEILPDRADRNACYVFSDPQARPALFPTTISGLVWLGRATGNDGHLELARDYMKIAMAHPNCARLALATKIGWSVLMLARHFPDPELTALARVNGGALIERQLPDGSISFDMVPDVPKPVDRVWLMGWNCDAALTLMALTDSGV